jgi:hypothetical protein
MRTILAGILILLGIFLWATPLWFVVLMEILFRCGIGYRRRGVPRRITMIEWLDVTGTGIFLGTILYGLGRIFARTFGTPGH